MAKIAYINLTLIVALGFGVALQEVPAPDLSTSDSLIRWIVAFLIITLGGGVFWIVRLTLGKIPMIMEEQTRELRAIRTALERADIHVDEPGNEKT